MFKMGPALIKKEPSNDGKNIIPFHSEHISDSRLDRRWRRKCKTLEKLKKCNTGASVKKPLDDATTIDLSGEKNCCGFQSPLEINDECHWEDNTDPQFNMFLKQVRPCGNFFALQVSDGVTGPILLRYEYDETCGDQDVPLSPKRLRIEEINGRTEAQDNLRNLPTEKGVKSFIENNILVEHAEPVTCRTDEGKRLEGCPHAVPNKLNKMPEVKRDKDEAYVIFLNNLTWVGDRMVYVNEGRGKVIYEKNINVENVSSFSQSIKIESFPQCSDDTFSPFTKQMSGSEVNIDEVQCLGSQIKSGSSTFREKLISVLRKPYDREEYRELLAEISMKRATERHRDLRGRIIRYPAGGAKSYLDLYLGVTKKIAELRPDHAKVLNILRGFFFWLTNVAHDGAFCPWSDESCLAVLPDDDSPGNNPAPE